MNISVFKSIAVKQCINTLVILIPLMLQGNALADQRLFNSIDDTRHFLQRTGFALPPEIVIEKSRHNAEQLLREAMQNNKTISPIEPPAWTQTPNELRPDFKSMPQEQRRTVRRQERKKDRERLRELQYWWLSNLVASENPLGARMVLFWQNHFVSEHRKVLSAKLLYEQHALLQQHALGNFSELLTAILQDPAMLVYLDNRSNFKSKPNENLARELFELFTLGEGNYNETDVKEAARALTGYGVTSNLEFRFRKKRHDDSNKNILGVTANHDMQSLIDLLLAQPATAELIVEKLWKEFVSPEPDQKTIEELAQVFTDANYEIKPLLTAIFRHQAFWAEENRMTLIKSPAQFIADTLRVWQLNIIKPAGMLKHMQYMEQVLFNPPNVKGWAGGNHWINSNTLLARNTFLKILLRSSNDRKDSEFNNAMNSMQSKSGMTTGPATTSNPVQVKAALIGSQTRLHNRDQLTADNLLQNLLTEPTWQLY